MFRTAQNQEIGKHLSDLINRKFKSTREFCREYLKLAKPENEPSKDEIDYKANNLSQIKQGNLGIQIEDLGYFSQLLDVSCEEILSAREHPASNEYRFTNYNFALSDNESYWEHYICRDDKIILNTDEYGMTVIDYAIRFKNYKLLKYLIDKGYIWFVDNNKDLSYSFGGGTHIKRDPASTGNLDLYLKQNDILRTDTAALAIENRDIEMLERIRARETPDLYSVLKFSGINTRYNVFYNEKLLEYIVNASDEVVDYFTESFSVKDADREMLCIFPYTMQLIEKMIEADSKNTSRALKNAIGHNIKVFDTISGFITDIYYTYEHQYGGESAFRVATNGLRTDKESNFILYYCLDIGNSIMWKSNAVRVGIRSKKPEINALIDELNEIFSDITEPNKNKIVKKRR